MIPDINRISTLCNDIFFFRERLREEIPEICPFDPDLADDVIAARQALNEVYKKLDKKLLDLDC